MCFQIYLAGHHSHELLGEAVVVAAVVVVAVVVVVVVVAVVVVADEQRQPLFAASGLETWLLLLHWPAGQQLVGQLGWHLSYKMPAKKNVLKV
jgi:hypothetical protein